MKFQMHHKVFPGPVEGSKQIGRLKKAMTRIEHHRDEAESEEESS